MNFKDYPETEDTLKEIHILRNTLKKIQLDPKSENVGLWAADAMAELDQVEESVKGYESSLQWERSYH